MPEGPRPDPGHAGARALPGRVRQRPARPRRPLAHHPARASPGAGCSPTAATSTTCSSTGCCAGPGGSRTTCWRSGRSASCRTTRSRPRRARRPRSRGRATSASSPLYRLDMGEARGRDPRHAPSYQLELEDITVGDGDEATKGSIVEVHYVGVSWKTGNQFDASWDRGDTFKFGLGKGQVIRGWDEGVAGMKVGGRRRITIPAGHGVRRARRGRRDRPERDARVRGRPDRRDGSSVGLMRTSLAPEERQRLARKRQEEEVTVDARLELAAMLGNQALARALARQPATLEAPAAAAERAAQARHPAVDPGALRHRGRAHARRGQRDAQPGRRLGPAALHGLRAARARPDRGAPRALRLRQRPRGDPRLGQDAPAALARRPDDHEGDEARLRDAARDLLPAPRERADEDLRRPVAGPRPDRGRGRRVRGQHGRRREDPRPPVPRQPVRDRRDAQRHRVRALPAGRGQDVLQHLRLRRRHRDGRLPAARLVDRSDVDEDPGRRRDHQPGRPQAHEEGQGGRLQRRRARVRRHRRRAERQRAHQVDAQDRRRVRLERRDATWRRRRPRPTRARS